MNFLSHIDLIEILYRDIGQKVLLDNGLASLIGAQQDWKETQQDQWQTQDPFPTPRVRLAFDAEAVRLGSPPLQTCHQ